MRTFVALFALAAPVFAQMVPDSFQPPRSYTGKNFRLVPLGPDVAQLDFNACMGSIGYDAVAAIWVTKDQFDKGFETQLLADMKAWLNTGWPFKKVAWPNRDIPMAEWGALPARK
jgi:hypothetical protein